MIKTSEEILRLNKEKILNLNNSDIQELILQFKNRNEMNVIDVSEVIYKLMTTLKLDLNEGRPKEYSIGGGTLGKILGIRKGVVSQYLSIFKMSKSLSQDLKYFINEEKISLHNLYYISKLKIINKEIIENYIVENNIRKIIKVKEITEEEIKRIEKLKIEQKRKIEQKERITLRNIEKEKLIKETIELQENNRKRLEEESLKHYNFFKKFMKRGLGDEMINNWFEGCNRHHINVQQIICIPANIHIKFRHDLLKSETMIKINRIAFEYLTNDIKQI